MKRATLLLLLLALFACGEDERAKPLSEPGEKLYGVRGVILSRNASGNSVNLDHEAIPGFMEAMKMEYAVRGADVAKLPADGSRIEAKLHVTSRAYWITDVKQVP
ncbi:MAG TPA: copper-binding protein [Thermoanaerobaculia bacterium]|nr:copper-binding protein [Thermoanaerobaculia bacterium]